MEIEAGAILPFQCLGCQTSEWRFPHLVKVIDASTGRKIYEDLLWLPATIAYVAERLVLEYGEKT